jgi:hypothetical protein
MFLILLVGGAEVVLLIAYVALRLVLKERNDQRLQRERAAAYFAGRDRPSVIR